MFGNRLSKEEKSRRRAEKQAVYDRVYTLHEQAEFLCYINDAYAEEYKGESFVKLEGLVAKGAGRVGDTFLLYDCEGRKKAEITMTELYLGTNSVEQLEGGDKRVALYPKEQNVKYQAGDILCKLKTDDNE